MSWWATLASYLRAVIGHVVVLLAGVIGVVLLLISLAAPKVTRIAGILVVAVAIALGQFLAWLDMRTARDRLQGPIGAERERVRRLREADEIIGETFNILDLVPDDTRPPRIEHKILRRCRIHGPAVLMQHITGEIGRNTFDGEFISTWFLDPPPHPLAPRSGGIQIFDVKIIDCTLYDIGVITTKDHAADFGIDLELMARMFPSGTPTRAGD